MDRYAVLAPMYDLVSLERPIYRPGRVAAVQSLCLRSGQTVLVVGCGTGLSMPLLASALGPCGRIVGVDASRPMLRAAARHTGLATPQALVRADATTLRRSDLPQDLGDVDALLFAYSLSLMQPWTAAWDAATGLLRAGARIAVADLALPRRGGVIGRTVARTLSAAGGADIDAHPWKLLERDCTEVAALELWGGHVQVRAGRWSGATRP